MSKEDVNVFAVGELPHGGELHSDAEWQLPTVSSKAICVLVRGRGVLDSYGNKLQYLTFIVEQIFQGKT